MMNQAIAGGDPVGIVGMGLIGGSLGLDLRARGVPVRALVHRPETAERALQRGLADAVSTDPAVLADCALVVLALPLDRLLAPDPTLLAALPPAAVITDVGSVKAPVLACWDERLAGRFVAGHPMAGTANAGVEAGETGLFQGRPWVATPTGRTEPTALAAVQGLAEALGARWILCDPDQHDRAVALISHLPVLVSAALLQAADRGAAAAGRHAGPGPAVVASAAIAAAGSGAAAPDPAAGLPGLVRALASSGFADTTRVGAGNPELGTLMARCNREALLAGLADYRRALDGLESLVRERSWPELQAELSHCQALRPPFL